MTKINLKRKKIFIFLLQGLCSPVVRSTSIKRAVVVIQINHTHSTGIWLVLLCFLEGVALQLSQGACRQSSAVFLYPQIFAAAASSPFPFPSPPFSPPLPSFFFKCNLCHFWETFLAFFLCILMVYHQVKHQGSCVF